MGQQIEIRRNQRLAAVLGSVAAVMAIAYLQRAAGTGGALDWFICLLMLVIGASQLLSLLDSRTPLLIADDQGIRVRLGQEWLGLPWATLEEVRLEQRDARIRDGRLIVRPRDLEAALEPLLASSKRAARWQGILHGAPLTVPLSIATRSSADRIVPQLRALADGRAEIVVARRAAAPVDRVANTSVDRAADATKERPRIEITEEPGLDTLAGARYATNEEAPVVDRVGEMRDESRRIEITPPVEAAPVAAVRPARKVVRAEIVSERERPRVETVLPELPAEAVARPEARPARQLVIGPVVRAARERAGLGIEELSDRTRIRPHVLEGIEADDFGPCGGDFYARGHLRTLARYLGLDAATLVADYDNRYAHAPISASRVFEAELASGMSGGIRVGSGGPRWGLIAAAVLSLLMVWGIARYFTDDQTPVAAPITSNSAGLAANTHPITSPLTRTRTVTIRAVGAPANVVVRDKLGTTLWSGRLSAGQHHGMAVVGPFQVRTTNASATMLRVGKRDLGPVSDLPGQATRVVD